MNTVAKTAAIPFLKKITPKTVTEAIGKIVLTEMNRPVKAQVLYDLFGIVNGVKQKADDKSEKGVWTQFKGQFRAVYTDPETGEVFQFESGATHIPMLEDVIHSTLLSAKEQDQRAQLEIAVRVAITPAKPGKPSMTGYEYDVQRLLPQRDDVKDPIAQLIAESAKANPPRLAAPASPQPPPPTPESPAPEAPETPPAHAHKSQANRK
jgi:hypothetical protein